MIKIQRAIAKGNYIIRRADRLLCNFRYGSGMKYCLPGIRGAENPERDGEQTEIRVYIIANDASRKRNVCILQSDFKEFGKRLRTRSLDYPLFRTSANKNLKTAQMNVVAG